jgi:hypothetical protein
MPETIDAVFQSGVFRPITPIFLPENHRFRISFDVMDDVFENRIVPPLPVGEYPLDSNDDREATPLPILSLNGGTNVAVRFRDGGEIPPLPYPEE